MQIFRPKNHVTEIPGTPEDLRQSVDETSVRAAEDFYIRLGMMTVRQRTIIPEQVEVNTQRQ